MILWQDSHAEFAKKKKKKPTHKQTTYLPAYWAHTDFGVEYLEKKKKKKYTPQKKKKKIL